MFADGERCPMLINKTTGVPLFDPTVWAMTEYRHLSASTMEQALRGAMLLHLFCSHRGIDLAQRVHEGTFFEAHEVAALKREARKPKRALASGAISETFSSQVSGQKRFSLTAERALPDFYDGYDPRSRSIVLPPNSRSPPLRGSEREVWSPFHSGHLAKVRPVPSSDLPVLRRLRQLLPRTASCPSCPGLHSGGRLPRLGGKGLCDHLRLQIENSVCQCGVLGIAHDKEHFQVTPHPRCCKVLIPPCWLIPTWLGTSM